MRNIRVRDISDAVARLCVEACCDLGADVENALAAAAETEVSPTGRSILGQLLENCHIARERAVPICQDCGLAVVFADVGREVVLDGSLADAVNDGVIRGYEEGYLRKSTCHPLTRANYGNNAPAILHTRLVEGDGLTLTVAPKGGGSENMSALKMFAPAAGRKGILDFVVDTVEKAGPNPCPPLVVGVGVGANFEGVALLAKRALLREVGSHNPDPELAAMETELLARINALGVGPAGLGGRTTALAVFVEAAPCHIASLPVAVNLNCHAARHRSANL